MDEQSNQTNKWYQTPLGIILIVILVFCILSGMGYLVYLKFFQKEGLQDSTDEQFEVSEPNYDIPMTSANSNTYEIEEVTTTTTVEEIPSSSINSNTYEIEEVTTTVTQEPEIEELTVTVTQEPEIEELTTTVTQEPDIEEITTTTTVEEIPSSSPNSNTYEIEEVTTTTTVTQEPEISNTVQILLTFPENNKIISSIQNEIQGLYEVHLTDKYLSDNPNSTVDSLGITDYTILDSRIKFINENGFFIKKAYSDPNDNWWVLQHPDNKTILQNGSYNLTSGWRYFNNNSRYHSGSHNELVGDLNFSIV